MFPPVIALAVLATTAILVLIMVLAVDDSVAGDHHDD